MAAPKPAITLVGNCQVQDLGRALGQLPRVAEAFDVCVVPLHLAPEPTAADAAALRRSRYVLAQRTSLYDDSGVAALIPGAAEVVDFPYVSMRFLWPYDCLTFGADMRAIEAIGGDVTYFPDGLLGHLRTAVPDKEARFEAYRALAIPKARRNVERMRELEFDLFRAVDRQYGLGVEAHVASRLPSGPVFHWVGHPGGPLYQMLLNHLLDATGIAPEPAPMETLDQWRHVSLPVHPEVARRLGIAWADEGALYSFGALGMVTWETYVRRYIDDLG